MFGCEHSGAKGSDNHRSNIQRVMYRYYPNVLEYPEKVFFLHLNLEGQFEIWTKNMQIITILIFKKSVKIKVLLPAIHFFKVVSVSTLTL